MSKDNAENLANQLYELQKQFVKSILLGKNAKQYQIDSIEYFFKSIDQINLNQVIDLQQLIGVVEEQVFKVNLAPPMLSMIGEMAQNLHHQLSNNNAPLASLISDQQVEHWIRKILELDHVIEYIKSKIEQTPQIRALCAYWINQNITHYTPENVQIASDKAISKLPPRIQRFIQLQQQKIEEKIEEKAAQLFQKQLLFLFSLDKDEYLNLGLSIWDNIKHKPISEYASKSSALDSEDLFILIYEFWKDFRQNESIQAMIRNGIEYFYQTFEDESILYLFESTGLTIKDIQTEALRFAPAILQRLEQLGLLDQYIDSVLKPFFTHESTIKTIQDALNTN